VYSDGYPLAVPPEKLEEAMQIFTSCQLRRPLGAVLNCAKDAAAGTFCPCIVAAGGGAGSGDRVIFEAVAAELERRIAANSDSPPAAGSNGDGATAQDQAEPRESDVPDEVIDEALEGTFPASDPPFWTLGPPRPAA